MTKGDSKKSDTMSVSERVLGNMDPSAFVHKNNCQRNCDVTVNSGNSSFCLIQIHPKMN